jgi:hypothetical protein
VCPADVHAALADHAATNCAFPPNEENTEDFLPEEIASPRFRLEAGDPVILRVELRFSASVWADEWEAARSSMCQKLPGQVEMVPYEALSLQGVAFC